jgi:predicted Zn-dependent protease
VRTRSWARETAAEPRPIVDNLILEGAPGGGGASLDEMIAATERGLLLTCLWYVREVDPQTLLLTGLTRDGVYLVEDGTVTGAVNNFRFNESPIDLLGRFTEASAPARSFSREWGDYFPRTVTPALRVLDFNMSSVSPAS